MKQLSEYINEKLVLSKDTFKKSYNYFPKTTKELKEIIEQLLEERKDDKVIDLNDIDTFKITNMSYLFVFTEKKIKNIDISRWDVSNVIDMYAMFYKCEKLESIGDLSNWDISNVTNMSYMFYKCKNLKSIGDISKWDISKVKYMNLMFDGSGITNIPSWYKD